MTLAAIDSETSTRLDPARLEAQDIVVKFEGLAALGGISLELRIGEILGLIGPNGAGKTTMVNVLTGFQAPTSGRVVIGGADFTTWPPQRRARHGIVRTFQNVRLFRHYSIRDNLLVSAIGTGLGKHAAGERADAILEWCSLHHRADARADTLPFGEERRVGIARALAMHPRFLLMDEPAAGLSDLECDALMNMVDRIPVEFSCGVLLIEHNMRVVMNVCKRIHVLDFGKTIAEGTPDKIQRNADVIRAYLGTRKALTRAGSQ